MAWEYKNKLEDIRIRALATKIKRQRQSESPRVHLRIYRDGSMKIGSKVYVPEPTPRKFHEDEHAIKALFGCIGCGKSVAAQMDVLKAAASKPLCTDGIYRSRWLFVRNTYDDLRRTTLKTWDEWLAGVPTVRYTDKPPFRQYAFNVWDEKAGKVSKCELEIIGISLDLVKDVTRKLKSLEVTGIYLNEGVEFPYEVFETSTDRIGRYPARQMRADREQQLKFCILDTNPCQQGHWFHHWFEVMKPENSVIYHYPAGLIENEAGGYKDNPVAENLEHLEKEYYSTHAIGKERSYIRVMYMGEYGVLRRGTPVYDSYNDDLHAVEKIEIDKEKPFYLGFDFGLTPACLIEQFVDGQRRSIKEFISLKSTQLADLLDNKVMPYLRTVLEGCEFIVTGDPSGIAKPQSEGHHCFKIMKERGLNARTAPTNELLPRLDAVRHFFNRMSNGQPAYIVSKVGCPVLREGYLSKYCYEDVKVLGETGTKEKPTKIHPHSDIQDAGQYNSLAMIGRASKKYVPPKPTLHAGNSGWI